MAMEIPAQVRRYWLPILLFTAGFLFQVLVLPRHFPPTHYDVLGVERFASVERVVEAYESLSKEWLSETSHQPTVDIIKIRYAYELLTNPVLKRDYDLFGLDEHKDVLERVKEQYQMVHFLKIDLPLLKDSVVSLIDDAFNVLTHESFMSAISEEYPLIILVYSKGSPRCAQFIEYWKQIGTQLDGIVRTAMVEVGDSQVAGYFAEKRFSKRPFFRNGVPTLVAYPANCKSPSCYMRAPNSLGRVAIIRSKLSFSQVLESVLLHSFAKLPKSIQVIHHLDLSYGEKTNPRFGGIRIFSKSEFIEMMEEHKHHELRQLRSDTSLELGCDARGHSRAGNDAAIWYCVIVAGRPGAELSKKRQILRKAQDKLLGDVDRSAGNVDNSVETSSAATAFKDDRLTFVWLDGEVQKQICAFYLATDYTGACGPRDFGDDNDKPEIFIVRFQRNATYEALKAEKKNNLVDVLQGQHADASQLVARYKGPVEIEEINRWISQIIKDGDTREIPYFTSKVPDLVPEETSKAWNSKSIRSAGKSLKENIGFHFQDYLTHPMIGSTLLMCGCISMGILWFRNNTPTQSTRQEKARKDKAKRPRPKLSTSLFGEPSVPDVDPKDARQWEMSSSDSD
ncbi:DNAJ heat shock N-terminal domain-containing protein [Zea mays]|uniref:DNAJ heat shock N-terminal domain-containing protein n=1 Tax=Zea mays TaxID=4577 RepID=A0A1D6F294_MAIZE|nr:DNAJ heat shock N-terminal domain-containing protein [Zea mays]